MNKESRSRVYRLRDLLQTLIDDGLNPILEEEQGAYDEMTGTQQESEAGEKQEQLIDALNEVYDAVSGAIESLNEVVQDG
jgi:ABC-type transporter Mla subunit MlaD